MLIKKKKKCFVCTLKLLKYLKVSPSLTQRGSTATQPTVYELKGNHERSVKKCSHTSHGPLAILVWPPLRLSS